MLKSYLIYPITGNQKYTVFQKLMLHINMED